MPSLALSKNAGKILNWANGGRVPMLTFEQFQRGIRKQKAKDPTPAKIVLKRKGTRLFRNGRRVTLYHSDELGVELVFPMMFET